MASIMHTTTERAPSRPRSPTDHNPPKTVEAAIVSEPANPSAYDYTYICMLFARATDVPPRPPFQTEVVTQETAVTTPAEATLDDLDSHDHWSTYLSFHRPSLWPSGSLIRVRFSGGTQAQWEMVRTYAAWWSAYANITFEFVLNGPSEVRITFNSDDGNWSVLGTRSLQRAQYEPTMNLNFTEQTPLDTARSAILHEFGHVLGAIHEHQSPLARIPWNRNMVYAWFNALGNSNDWVDHNVLNQPFPAAEIDADADSESIMVYPYPPALTTNQTWVPWVDRASIRDYFRIASMYPRNQYVVYIVRTNQPIDHPQQWQSITNGIMPPRPAPPQFAVVLSGFDFDRNEGNIRVRTEVTNVQTDRYTVGVGTWGNRVFYNGDVSLLQMPANDPNFRVGTITSAGGHSHRIPFQPPFPLGAVPEVFAAFSGIDVDDNWRGQLQIRGQTHAYFDIEVSTWGSSNLYTANVQWVAYPNNLPGVEMGTFRGVGGSSGTSPLRNRYYNVPSVFTGFQHFDISPNANARLRVEAEAVDINQVNWEINTWSDSRVYAIIGVYLAIST